MIVFILLYLFIGGLGDSILILFEIINFILCDLVKEINNNNIILKVKYWVLNMFSIYINILINIF